MRTTVLGVRWVVNDFSETCVAKGGRSPDDDDADDNDNDGGDDGGGNNGDEGSRRGAGLVYKR